MKLLLLAAALALPPSDTLPVPHAYLDALAAGTRSRTGAPGPNYWTQRADYTIQVRLDPATAVVEGSEVIRYTNHSPDTLTQVAFNLNQNVFAPGNPRNRPAPVTGGLTLSRVVLQGSEIDVTPPLGWSLPTNLALDLPEPLPPGGVAEFEIDWSFEVPEGTFRMGREGNEVFFLAQWYPQVAVYDDLRGWSRDPYMGNGEFYVDYGDFDVSITVPHRWLVSASGILQNPEEVLTVETRARLEAAAPDTVVRVITVDEIRDGAQTRISEDGLLTWRYRAENVRDFAWGTSNRYQWDATVARYPGLDGAPREAAIHVLYRPGEGREHWIRGAEFAKESIEVHSRWYPYPYPQMTVNEGIIGGGMEYPMITILGGGRSERSLYGVTSHEIAHMWWPMVVGSDEKAFAWMDEGLASFSEDLFAPEMFPGTNPGFNSMMGYLRIAGSDAETESMRHADLYGPFGNRGLASYSKPATVFRALRGILGEEVFAEALGEYISRWAFKHPHPLDLFWTFEDVTGRDLDWFFHPWLYTTRVMDQALTSVEVFEGGRRIRVTLEDRGEIAMPVLLEVSVEGADPVRIEAAHDRWDRGRMELEVSLPAPVTGVTLDPEMVFPDVNRGDNAWSAETP